MNDGATTSVQSGAHLFVCQRVDVLLVRAEQHVSQQRAALLAHGHLLVDHGWTVGTVHQDLRGKGTEQLERKSVTPSSSRVSHRKKKTGGKKKKSHH